MCAYICVYVCVCAYGFYYAMASRFPSYKIVLIGDTNTGKTTYANAIRGVPRQRTTPTMGANINEMVNNGVSYWLWDCAGDDRFAGLADGYYLQANGAIIFATSEQNAADWLMKLRRVCETIPFVVVDPAMDSDEGEVYSPHTDRAFKDLATMMNVRAAERAAIAAEKHAYTKRQRSTE